GSRTTRVHKEGADRVAASRCLLHESQSDRARIWLLPVQRGAHVSAYLAVSAVFPPRALIAEVAASRHLVREFELEFSERGERRGRLECTPHPCEGHDKPHDDHYRRDRDEPAQRSAHRLVVALTHR